MHHGMPLFLDQLIAMLQAEEHEPEPVSHGRNSRATKPGQAGTETGCPQRGTGAS